MTANYKIIHLRFTEIPNFVYVNNSEKDNTIVHYYHNQSGRIIYKRLNLIGCWRVKS